MGRDKALLPWGETDLLGHAVARLRAVAGEVRVLSGSEARYLDRGVAVLTDPVAGAGPLAGVMAGLGSLGDQPGLFLAVDLPHVPVALLARLVERRHDADAVVPISPRGPEPLCAVYRPSCLEPIRRRMAAGDLKMTAFWPEVRVLRLGPEELAAFGDPGEMFRNLNTPVDLREPAAG